MPERIARLFAAARFLAITLLLALPPVAFAAERITLYTSDITVNRDGTLDVIETITVNAEGQQIRRGIFREFPTTYRDRFNNRIRVDFTIVSVARNDQPEPYSSEPLSNGVRIRIGSPDVYLPNGRHTYRLHYRTNRQLGFFEEYDELYWNVTGTDWDFMIERAVAQVHLPAGTNIVRKVAYTGPDGATGSDYRPLSMPDGAAWETTRPLAPGEGLTIAIAWPKGVVAEPTLRERWGWFIRDNRGNGTALLGVMFVFGYYLLAWRRYGRDPLGGTVIPRFAPPEGLSPAAVRFIRLMNFDRKAFSAALLSMAVKGYLIIHDSGMTSGKSAGKGFTLERAARADALDGLSGGERRIAKQLLLTIDNFVLTQANHETLRTAIRKLRESLETEYEVATFQRNTLLFIVGLALSGGAVVLTAQQSASGIVFLAGLLVAVAAAVLTFAGLHYWGDDADPTFKVFPFSSLPAIGLPADMLRILFFFFVMMGSSAGAVFAQLAQHPLQGVCFAVLGGLNALFFFLLKRPTRAGRKLMDEIAGFRLYLKTAEEHRLEYLHPPEKTPQLFERYLPYAIALDVENAWADKFADVLAQASREPGGGRGSYQPRWYRGRSWSSSSLGAVGARLGSVVAASARPPGSSSGSGGSSGGGFSGGGFSGGGGGGGGGGGW